jgi:hypothetical protein
VSCLEPEYPKRWFTPPVASPPQHCWRRIRFRSGQLKTLNVSGQAYLAGRMLFFYERSACLDKIASRGYL